LGIGDEGTLLSRRPEGGGRGLPGTGMFETQGCNDDEEERNCKGPLDRSDDKDTDV